MGVGSEEAKVCFRLDAINMREFFKVRLAQGILLVGNRAGGEAAPAKAIHLTERE